MKRLIFAAALCAATGPASAQQFTEAAQVRPILEATRANWVAIREYGGKDLLYFTQLLAWRCGLDRIEFALNDDPTFTDWPMPACRMDTATPASILEGDPVYATLPIWNVGKVRIRLTYDDGQVSEASYERAQIQIE